MGNSSINVSSLQVMSVKENRDPVNTKDNNV